MNSSTSSFATRPVAAQAPFRKIAYGPYESHVEARDDGSFVVSCPSPLQPYPRCFTERLVRWARERPGKTAFAKRDAAGQWQRLTFAEALRQAEAIGQALLDRGLDANRPVAILSENDLDHAVLALACQHVGIAYCAISAGYSLLSKDYGKLRHAIDLLTPGLVFAADGARYGAAIAAVVPADTEVVLVSGSVEGRATTSFEALRSTVPTVAVRSAYESIGPDTIAKFLFTSGSTKMPKAVINTHRMLCCNQQMYLQTYPDIGDDLVLLDWLPWHHTAAGNNNFGMTIFHGGTMYIDDGKPTAQQMHETIRNLHEIAPTWYCTVPKGLEDLVSALRSDEALGRTFFSKLKLIFPAGAAVPQPLRDALDEMSVRAIGARIPMTMGLGMTETSPSATSAHVEWWQPGIIGIPNPEVVIKLVPAGDKLEVRYQGPNVTPGYWRQSDMTAEAFDEDGFFRSGDAARFIDDADRERGMRYDGRLAEDFKLMSGTWVNVGNIRMKMIAAGAPYVWDVVLTGHDRNEIGVLVVLHAAPSRALCDTLTAESSLSDIAANAKVRAHFQALLDRLSSESTGSSTRIAAAVLLGEAPSFDAGEVTDKGSINQRTVLKMRLELVEAIYAESADARVLRASVAP